MDDAVVGRCAKSQKGDQTVWVNCATLLWYLLDLIFIQMIKGFTTAVLIVLTFVVIVGCEKKASTQEETTSTSEQPVTETDERPALTAVLTTGETFELKSQREPMVVILFQPECDDCQIEARDISTNLSAFKGYKLYFFSSHPVDVLKKFATDYGLENQPNVIFGQVTVDHVIQYYGQIHAPSIYIYNAQGKLKKSFNGKTDVNMIIEALTV